MDAVALDVANQLYDLLLIGSYMVQVGVVVLLLPPLVARPVGICAVAWLYSYYSFEYKWVLLGWSVTKRLDYFELYWAYFLGFGLPLAVLLHFAPSLLASALASSGLSSFLGPSLISSGLLALLFPIQIILGTAGQPLRHRSSIRLPHKLPIFWLADTVSSLSLRLFHWKVAR